MTERNGTIRTADDTDIYYEIHGGGPPMVMIAGLGDDHMSWAPQVKFFSNYFSVIAFDNRGIGKSSTPKGPYSVRQMAEDTHHLATSLDLSPVIAMGSSMGGAISQEWAIKYPDDIDQLILTNTWAKRDAFTDALFDHWISLANTGGGKHIVESLLVFCYSPAFLNSNPQVAADFLSFDPPRLDGFAAAAQACHDHHSIDRVQNIRHRTLVIAGEQDILTRAEFSQHLADAMPNAEYTSFPTGHMVFWEMPDGFNERVAQFLKLSN